MNNDKKWCSYHKRNEPVDAFRENGKGKYRSWCIEGAREYSREYNKSYKPYLDRKEETIRTKEKQAQAKTKICNGPLCNGKTLPIEKFPLRSDRPGKRHSRCSLCRSEINKGRNRDYYYENQEKEKERRKEYQRSNPGHGGGKTRRIAEQKVRKEHYRGVDIWAKSGGLCYFCKKSVDPKVEYPNPMCAVFHHEHPVSKRGPDVEKNVFLAHHSCNDSASNDFKPEFSDWQVERVAPSEIIPTIIEKHYLHRRPSISFAYACYGGDSLQGVVTFGSPSSWRTSKSVCSEDVTKVIELNRLWVNDDAPYGLASWFVAKALRELPPYIVITYADLSAGHDGAIYRALSFNYAGESRPRKEWRMPGSSRNAGRRPGAEQVQVGAKRRFWTTTGDKRERKRLEKLCQWPP